MLRAMPPNRHILAFVIIAAVAAASPAIAAERTAAPTFGDLDVLQRELVGNADAVRASEEELERLDTRLAVLGEEQIVIRSQIQAQRISMGRILAAMQRLGREPPSSLMLSPGTMEDAVRSGVLLKALYKTLEERSLVLSRTLQQVRIVEGKLQAARDSAERARSQLDVKRSRLSALVAERRELYRILQPRNEVADKEATKSAKTVNALLGKLEQADPVAKQEQSTTLAERPKPASARIFAQLKGSLRLPVTGRIVGRYGEANSSGEPQRGVTIATRAGAQVVSPVGGEVLFSGPFRSYGTLLIIAPAEGYHVLLAGLGTLDVSAGQWLLAGEPVGRVGENGPKNVGISGSETSVYIEFRNKGHPIDPTSWMRGIKRKVTG